MERAGAMAVTTSPTSISASFCSNNNNNTRRSRGLISVPSTSCCFSVAPAASGALSLQRIRKCSFPLRPTKTRTATIVRRGGRNAIRAKSEDVGGGIGAGGGGAIAGGLLANPVVWWSLYTLKSTGCGLPPGPGGSIGAIEGVSYLVVFGVIGWSLYTKAKTGSGLPQGPFGLLGAVEGISYLSVLAIVAVFGLQALDFGYIPGPLPGKECFG